MRQHFPIGELHKKWILENFKKKEIVFDEESMISILENENSTFSLKLDAAIALREIGTKNCIGALLNSIHLRNRDLQAISILTIAQIKEKNAVGILLPLLKEKGVQKDYVLWALYAIDAKEVVPDIQKFVQTRMNIDKRPSSKRISNVEYGLVMIENYGLKSENRTEILAYYNANWERLSIQQQTILKENTKYYKKNMVS